MQVDRVPLYTYRCDIFCPMNGKIQRVTFLFLFLTIAGCAIVWGQANTASIRGLVTDPSGAVVPGATVTLMNTGTGVQTVTKTNPAGEYLFEFLSPGTYRIEVRT